MRAALAVVGLIICNSNQCRDTNQAAAQKLVQEKDPPSPHPLLLPLRASLGFLARGLCLPPRYVQNQTMLSYLPGNELRVEGQTPGLSPGLDSPALPSVSVARGIFPLVQI